MTAEEEQKIRERAYFIWEQEGRPYGRDLQHRQRAEAEIAEEKARAAAIAPEKGVRGTTEPDETAHQTANRGNRAVNNETVRKTRRLAPPKEPVNGEEQARSSEQPGTARKIAPSQISRVRTLARYGMTAAQVAKAYGVEIGEIRRILRGG